MPRFTTRRLMLFVVSAGIIFGLMVLLDRRRSHFVELARAHEGLMVPSRRGLRAIQRRWNAYQFTRVRKYNYAARYPWLPVLPDPPVPK